jgi:hypothetical protein
LGAFVRDQYSKPFHHSALDPEGVRNLMLHGHYNDAIDKLMHERDTLTNDYRQLLKALQAAPNEGVFYERIYKWLDDEASPAAARMERSKREGSPEAYTEARINMAKVWNSAPDISGARNAGRGGALAATSGRHFAAERIGPLERGFGPRGSCLEKSGGLVAALSR